MKPMYIYVAGPYTKGDVAMNVRYMIHDADYIARLGHFYFCPLYSHFHHMLIPHDYEFWMKQDFAWVEKCDAIYRMKGESAGADREVELARSLGLIVYDSVFDIPKVDE